MPAIRSRIADCQTLYAKLESSNELRELQSDLDAIAGIRLRLLDPGIKPSQLSQPCADSPLCERVRNTPKGCEHCRRFIEGQVRDPRSGKSIAGSCDAGLSSFCVPLRIGGETIGYLLAGGYRVGAVDARARNRLRHLLERLKVADPVAALAEYESATVALTVPKEEAIQRWLQLAAEHLLRGLEVRDDFADRPLPVYIVKICAVIQRRFREPPTLREAAAICGLSTGYFSRSFHDHTGLRFVEYIHAVQIEHVCDLLEDPRVSITDAAFEVGFQSISQFNRVFRNLKGMPPRRWRTDRISRDPGPQVVHPVGPEPSGISITTRKPM